MREPPQPDRGSALFLDFDGTLVEIAPRPDAVTLPPELRALLLRLHDALGGALALVTGRPLADLDLHLDSVSLPAAGIHGLERRGLGGLVRPPGPDLSRASAIIEAACAAHPGLVPEFKGGALALHYRLAPGLQDVARDAIERAAAASDDMRVLHGKAVVELVPTSGGKGRAIEAFLLEEPFRDRRPWFVGDDITDEEGFGAVRARGGVAIKVGAGASQAPHRLVDPRAVRDWLERTLVSLESDGVEPASARGGTP